MKCELTIATFPISAKSSNVYTDEPNYPKNTNL